MEPRYTARIQTFGKILLVMVFVYLFLLSISLLGAAFKGFGEGFAEGLLQTTSNPFVALFIGIIATSIIQSSSTTTSIVVGLVASGAITIGNAVPIIMGANIGTTVTNTLVSLGHITRREEFKRAIAGASVHDFFNLLCVAILFPLELATGFLQKMATSLSGVFVHVGGIQFISPIKTLTEPVVHYLEHLFIVDLGLGSKAGHAMVLLLSVILLFLSLYFIVRLMRALVIKRTEVVLTNIFEQRGVIAVLAGILFTAIVQSSSITTSLLVPLIGAGIMTVEIAFPITIGANIGTTSTAILASFATGNVAAITIAFVHLLFNMIGALIIYPIKICRQVPIYFAKALGNLAYRKRRYAILFVVTFFFVLPAFMIFISRLI